jgi:hypothetical protein
MKKILSKTAFNTVMLVAISAFLFSFTNRPGGEGFQIYLGDKLVVEQFGTDMKNVKSLEIPAASYNEELMIKYHHCGKVGKNRVITIKDQQDHILKQWHFADSKNTAASMSCKVKDIVDLKNKKSITLKLYYSSSELPSGRLLASL